MLCGPALMLPAREGDDSSPVRLRSGDQPLRPPPFGPLIGEGERPVVDAPAAAPALTRGLEGAKRIERSFSGLGERRRAAEAAALDGLGEYLAISAAVRSSMRRAAACGREGSEGIACISILQLTV